LRLLRRALRLGWFVYAVALLGCGKTSRRAESDEPAGGIGDEGAGASSGSSGAHEAGGSSGRDGTPSGGGSEEGGEPGCVTEAPPSAPIRRLNRFEYENSLRELFGEQSWREDALPPDGYEDPMLAPAPALVEAHHALARDLALRVTQTESATYAFIGCDAAREGEEECRDRFIGEFVARAFRRPLTDWDIDRFTSKFDVAAEDGGFPLGVRAVVQITLQSPEFLYRPEFGADAPERGEGWARPAPYEMASRLAYFLWGAPPDAELLEAARVDELRSPDELEAQARRMLADPRAFQAVGYFYTRLLQLDGATFPAAGLPEFPTFTPEVAAHLVGETESFVADVTLVSDGDFRALLTAPYTFVNEPLAALYGIPGVSGNEFRRVAVEPSRRGGLLTHASFLAATALGPFTNPSERGLRIAEAFLCLEIPREPAGARIPEPLLPNTTTRQRYARHTADAACAACHALFDPLGFAFEHYDAAGLYRETENGVQVDATGSLVRTDAAGAFDGALELADRLAGSEDARRCFVRKWFGFAHGRAVDPADACLLAELDREFLNAGTNLKELLVALVRSDGFLYRPEVAP
jgi:hypothetical protein